MRPELAHTDPYDTWQNQPFPLIYHAVFTVAVLSFIILILLERAVWWDGREWWPLMVGASGGMRGYRSAG